MKDSEDFSEEYLKELINSSADDLTIALARIALAAKQANPEPVCFIGKQMLNDLIEENRSCGRVWLAARDEVDGNDRVPLYTTPQPAHTEVNSPVIPDGWKLVPVEPTEDMVINGFESKPDKFFSPDIEWEAYDAMSGCAQAAHRAKLCWAAMLESSPKPE